MKQMIKGLVGLFLASMLSMPLFASTHSENIFPSYTGLKARTQSDRLNLRHYPSMYSEPITKETPMENLYILGMNDDWYRVRIEDEEGWVSKKSIEALSHSELIPYSKVLGEEIVEYGKLFIGTPYVWGGNDLKYGVDCSGLTKKVFEGFDISISRLSYTQVNDGKVIPKSELKPGDLVFFDTSGYNNVRISHVGIYAGADQFLHADCTKGVTLSRLSSAYYSRNYVTGSRIINDL